MDFANQQPKTRIKTLFGQYVPPAHVEKMLENHHLAGLEGESRHMTVLFSDIRSFTTISEGLKATKLKQMLNEFLPQLRALSFSIMARLINMSVIW